MPAGGRRLFRRVLRAHRQLPVEMRSLGDDYVKAGVFLVPGLLDTFNSYAASPEFRRHRTTDNPLHIIGFLSEWKMYLDDLNKSAGTEFRGKALDPTVVESVSSRLPCFASSIKSEVLRPWCRCHRSRLASSTSLCTRRGTFGKPRTSWLLVLAATPHLRRNPSNASTKAITRRHWLIDTASCGHLTCIEYGSESATLHPLLSPSSRRELLPYPRLKYSALTMCPPL